MKQITTKIFLAIFLFASSSWAKKVNAQALSSIDTFFLSSPVDSFVDLSNYAYVLVDSTASLDWTEAWEKKKTGAFFPLKSLEMEGKFARGRYDYWMFFVIKSQLEKESLALYFKIAAIDTIHLYILEKDRVVNQVLAGKRTYEIYDRANLPFCEKNDIPLFIEAQQTYSCLVRMTNQNSFPAELTPRLMEQSYNAVIYGSGYRNYYLFYGGFFSVLLFLTIFTLLQYVQNKDKAFLFYALYIFALLMFFLREFDLRNFFTYIFPFFFHEHRFYSLMGISPFVAYFLFIDHFLEAKKRFPWLHRFLRYWVWIFLAFMGLDQIISSFDTLLSWKMIYGFRILTGIASLFVVIRLLFIKDRMANYVVIGTLILLCGNLTTIAVTVFEVFEETWWDVTQIPGYTGIVVELLFFSTVLGYRHRLAELEKSRVERDLARKESETASLKEVSRIKTNFYTNITHEFRTPLTVIQGVAGELKNNGEAKKLIQQNSKQLLQLINQLLDLSKLESGSMPLNRVQGDIIAYLNYLTESFHTFAFSRKINVSFYAELETLYMDYDPEKTQKIVVNLLSNAIKFTPEYGSVKVMARVSQKGDARFLELQVKDTGRGIPEASLPYIFDRFFQADESVIREEEGSGIGLAIVKELTELHGGTIAVESIEDRGTTFTLTFPISQHADKREEAFPTIKPLFEETLPINTPSLEKWDNFFAKDEKAQLLIIEDNYGVIQYLNSILKKHFDIQVARNGNAGIEKAFSQIPDVIICDVMMPEKNGFEVCELLKNDERTSHIPILLLTAKATQMDRLEGLSKGADAYLVKPFHKEELLLRLDNFLKMRERLQEHLRNDRSAEAPLSSEQQFLEKVNQSLQQHLDDPEFNSTLLARAVGLGRPQLHRKLKALTGLSTSLYMRAYRLQQARQLLLSTELRVSEIVWKTGFKSLSWFNQAYRQEFGENPSDTRNT